MTATLLLEHGEIVEMRTSDNKRLSMRCSKSVGEQPAVDLLPNVRYVLRASSASPLERGGGALLLEAGVLTQPLRSEEGAGQRSFVALNLSDKIVRLVNGGSLLDGSCVSSLPPREARPAFSLGGDVEPKRPDAAPCRDDVGGTSSSSLQTRCVDL